MTEESQSFSDAIDQAIAESMAASEVESNETAEVEAEETLFEEDNLDVADTEEVAEGEDTDEAEAESEDEESEEEAEEEAEESEDEESELLTLGEDDEVVINGETVKVGEALLRHADYTKKTQALSEERKAFETEKESLTDVVETMSSLDEAWAMDQSGVIATFLSNADDAVDAVGEAVVALASDGEVDPNMFVVRTIVSLISNDMIEDDLREMLGFDDEMVARVKEQGKQDARIRKLEKQARTQPAESAPQVDEQAAIADARTALLEQWESIVEGDSHLSSLDEEAQHKIRSEVAQLALDRGGIPLDVAWELLQAKQAKVSAQAKAKVQQKKRSTKAVSKPSNGTPSKSSEPLTLADAIAESMRELGG